MDFNEKLLEAIPDEKGAERHFDKFLRSQDQSYELVFPWDGCTWFGRRRPADNVQRLADCEVRLLFTIRDDAEYLRPKTTYVIETESSREGVNQFHLSPKELASPTKLTAAFWGVRQVASIPEYAMFAFIDYLLKDNPPNVHLTEYQSLIDGKQGAELTEVWNRIARRSELPNKGAQDALRLLRGDQSAQ